MDDCKFKKETAREIAKGVIVVNFVPSFPLQY